MRHLSGARLLAVSGILLALLIVVSCQTESGRDRTASGERAESSSSTAGDASSEERPSDKPAGVVGRDEPFGTLTSDDIVVRSFETDEGWGYTVLVKGEPLIHQPHVPAVPGDRGFDSEDAAVLVGRHVAEKLRKGVYPPYVTVEELESLGVFVSAP
jgi:hypothetical protein